MPLSPKILRRQAELVLQIVRDTSATVATGVPADATLARFYRDHPEFGSRDRRLFSEIVFAFFRWKGWLTPDAAPTLETACVLAHALEAASIHPTMAMMAGSARLATPELEPLGGLGLEAKAAGFARLTGHGAPAIEALVPAWCLPLLRVPPGLTVAEHLARMMAAFQTPPLTWLRARPGQGARVAAALQAAAGVPPTAMSSVPEALGVPRGMNLRALSSELNGAFEIQDLASQLVGRVCAPQAGETWWDTCCGSGGKTLHLADLMGGRGRVLATDVRPGMLEGLARRLREARVPGIELRQWDGLKDPPPSATYDGVLVDAPCSGLGTWHRNPDARWRMSLAEVERLSGVQRELLKAGAAQVRPGGTLVYATCTLTRVENDEVVDRFLAAAPAFAPAAFAHPLDGTACAGRLWVLPSETPCNGMFMARLIRR